MQMTIYYNAEDQYLVEQVDKLANRDRKSRSAVILTILEAFFERNKKIGEILQDQGVISAEDVDQILQFQQSEGTDRKFGEVATERGLVSLRHVQRALSIQELAQATHRN